MQEIWKPVKNYENLYWVSNFGRIKNSKKILKGTINKGYNRISLTKNKKEKNYFVHRLILEAFGFYIGDKTVNHKDGNKLNNHIDNLEIISVEENNKHAYENKLRKTEDIIPVKQYDLEGNYIDSYRSINEASRKTGLDIRHISRNIKGIGIQIGGFKFVRDEACID